ncbi:hypothetical protein NP493_2928g00000 [Ridgeia piscesae]|uniref:Uncharacterized protein n=1 Tax=Ridgeia piscesae TaxID=27915 RepID=A0AAD9JAQ1_RIDPI|nr:hypothetical protein NP493_2928g00000 [Ridgeia piscesae]
MLVYVKRSIQFSGMPKRSTLYFPGSPVQSSNISTWQQNIHPRSN